MLPPQYEVRSKQLAQRLWWLLPRDDACTKIDRVAAQLRANGIDEHLLALAVSNLKRHLSELDEDAGHG
jgi:hypothetical protein